MYFFFVTLELLLPDELLEDEEELVVEGQYSDVSEPVPSSSM